MYPTGNDFCVRNVDTNQILRTASDSCSKNNGRVIYCVHWQYHETKERVKSKIKVLDINNVIKTSKLTWGGHITRMANNSWKFQLTDWKPRDDSRPTGKLPRKRWRKKSMTSGNLSHGIGILKICSHRKAELRLSSNK